MRNLDYDDDPQFGDLEVAEPLDEDIENPSELDEEDELDSSLATGHKRELLTSVLDYNLNTLSDLVSSKQIDLSPEYQRRDRWRQDRQSKLIESFLMNVPVPPIFLNEDDYGKYSVIDGKQRLTAVHDFIRGRLRLKGMKVFKELNGFTIDDLSPALRAIIGTRSNLRATIILRQSDKEVKFEVFRRLNTGGVKLNAQEIRNSTWPGPTNDLMHALSAVPLFRDLLGIRKLSTSTLYKQMRDVELVLRYFTFRQDWDVFSGGMSRRLDDFMANNQRLKKSVLLEMEHDFISTLRAVEAAFGEHAFRRYSPETNSWRTPILAALYDAQMFACMGRDPDAVRPHRARILKEYQALFSDPTFRRSIDAATNTPKLFRDRITILSDLVTGVTAS
ncbi:DUF262 domain-containing protein [Citricoccus nitrophenolicus]|uniref:DUF262 domain-containing protein n=1 Tax=Citricoccus nitrophenolicus TaxID=863575 RepID=A0ABV0IH25_9MICC